MVGLKAGHQAVGNFICQIAVGHVIGKLRHRIAASRAIKAECQLHEREIAAVAQTGLIDLIDGDVIKIVVVAIGFKPEGHAFLGEVSWVQIFAKIGAALSSTLMEIGHCFAQ